MSRRRRRRRRGCRGERGAQTLEFVACMALLVAVLAGIGKALAVARLQAEADSDARVLARQEATCDSTRTITLDDVDRGAADRGLSASVSRLPAGRFAQTVDVELPPPLALLGLHPRAVLVMAYEPGCGG